MQELLHGDCKLFHLEGFPHPSDPKINHTHTEPHILHGKFTSTRLLLIECLLNIKDSAKWGMCSTLENHLHYNTVYEAFLSAFSSWGNQDSKRLISPKFLYVDIVLRWLITWDGHTIFGIQGKLKMNVCVPPKFIYPNPQGDSIRRSSLWEVIRLCSQGEEQYPYKKDSRELPGPFCHVGTQQKDSQLWIRKRVLTRYQIRQPLISDFSASKIVRNNSCCL